VDSAAKTITAKTAAAAQVGGAQHVAM